MKKVKGKSDDIKIEGNLDVIEGGRVTLPKKWREDNDVVKGDVLKGITVNEIVRIGEREKKK